LVREIVAAGHPIPTDEQDPAAGKGSISAAYFLKKLAWIGTNANRLDPARKSVRIDGHPLQVVAGTKRCVKFYPIGWRWPFSTRTASKVRRGVKNLRFSLPFLPLVLA
jgi:hypothetical protein